jgi:hypothetical protein
LSEFPAKIWAPGEPNCGVSCYSQVAKPTTVPASLSRLILLFILLLALGVQAQDIDSTLFAPMQWRLIGPFRAGRVTSVAGVPSEPDVYYFGTPGGGAWKSIDGGRVWKPIFDRQPVSGIGSIAVALSSPQTIYLGTGETGTGNGVYKSLDAGSTWIHTGLEKRVTFLPSSSIQRTPLSSSPAPILSAAQLSGGPFRNRPIKLIAASSRPSTVARPGKRC